MDSLSKALSITQATSIWKLVQGSLCRSRMSNNNGVYIRFPIALSADCVSEETQLALNDNLS